MNREKTGQLREQACISKNPKYQEAIARKGLLYQRLEDIRSPFSRDYNRILHSTAFSRLKHKTQVFFAVENDHICTRMEHVNHVASIGQTISSKLGLNTQLANAIALGHDLGHAPFGHAGETKLKEIARKELGIQFWHEKNSLRFVDDIETLKDPENNQQNLNLTYAVRDGIVCHCGEIFDEHLHPRDEALDLNDIKKADNLLPFTWEGCVVRVADKIAYLGRDIDDAQRLGILTSGQDEELKEIVKDIIPQNGGNINNTVLIHKFILDLCDNSTLNSGICFSKNMYQLMKLVKKFNYENIYDHPRLSSYKKYANLILESIYEQLYGMYSHKYTLDKLKENRRFFPSLLRGFYWYIIKYSDLRWEANVKNRNIDKISKYKNKVLYKIDREEDYKTAILDYLSGMTDNFAIRSFGEITSFR
ncbi:MAG: HD domain-containing protein [Desulfarculus sp.]|nr:HD domain-containing protein [Pseudomonadota bacterium]MBV1714951.1 HD domain-containing protein [Desulfarculus sp.]MBU4577119.1 HD domain-containing protein [Pseudomonadota bacterium]MBU4598996.1 HD domain-containing protein [Pseudomonadota bacterium]MBV1737451.1 HD domain-containing protein [Desulfarculus sp.]